MVRSFFIDDLEAWNGLPNIYTDCLNFLTQTATVCWFDALMVKIRAQYQVRNRAVYLALGLNLEGHKEVLGLWSNENEGAKFWLQIATDLQARGVRDILLAGVDGLKGLPDAIVSVFPQTEVQLCLVHLVRYSFGSRDPQEMARSRFHRAANYPTTAGTPQGGVISPALMNLTLDGLEPLLAKHFPPRSGKLVNLVRFAEERELPRPTSIYMRLALVSPFTSCRVCIFIATRGCGYFEF